MVVVIILTTLVAAALPVMAPNSETRRLREAGRSLQTAISAAQTKATELGRPYGIWLEKQSAVAGSTDPRDMGAVMTVHFCEEPLPFAGFSRNSSAILVPRTAPKYPTGHVVAFGQHNPSAKLGDPRFVIEPLPPAMFRPGDRLIIRGAVYRFTQPEGVFNETEIVGSEEFLRPKEWYFVTYEGNPKWASYLVYQPNVPPLDGFPLWSTPQSFTILRQPQRVGDPLQLPAGTAIDLEASGDRSYFYHDPLRPGDPLNLGEGANNNLAPVVVLFSPGGGVHSVIRNDGGLSNSASLEKVVQAPSDGTIYLMVGRRERTGESSADPRLTTWLDPESLWVSIAPQTGRVVTEENHPVEQSIATLDSTSANYYSGLVAQRQQARQFARQSHGLGGR